MIEVSLDYNRGRYYIEFVSRKRVRFLLDTGSNCTRVSGKSIKKLLYTETGEPTLVTGLGGSVDGTDINLILYTPDLSYSKEVVASIIDDGHFISQMKLLSHNVDGLLGMDFLENCVIDFSKSLLTIIDKP